MNIHIHAPQPVTKRKFRRHCPTCQKRTTFIAFGYEWYGWLVTCLSCGDQWSDGERCERPFARGWRAKSIERAKKRWANS